MAFSGSRLAAGRMAAGLTQQRLAELVHTEQTRVSDWERGRMTPRPSLIPRLASAIGLDALEFLAADTAAPTVEDLRLAAGLTMGEVAERVDVSIRRYRGIEIGATRRDPHSDLLDALARVFAVPSVTVQRAIDAARL